MTVLLSALADDTAGSHNEYLPGIPGARHRLTRTAPALLLGDHSVSDPPDPISNSAVKPDSADGTVAQAPEE
jgi:hypothetical protein